MAVATMSYFNYSFKRRLSIACLFLVSLTFGLAPLLFVSNFSLNFLKYRSLSILENDHCLLEPLKDKVGKEVKVQFGSGVVRYCSKMFYRKIPVAIKTFQNGNIVTLLQKLYVVPVLINNYASDMFTFG